MLGPVRIASDLDHPDPDHLEIEEGMSEQVQTVNALDHPDLDRLDHSVMVRTDLSRQTALAR